MIEILKAGLKVGLATLATILGWLIAGKIFALTLGAAGVGLFGLLRQLLQNLTLLGSFNGQTALVQGISSRSDKLEKIRFTGSILCIQILIAVVLALGLLLGAQWLGPWLIPHPQAVELLRWLVLAMVMVLSQAFTIGLINGHRLVDDFVKAQLIGPLAVVILAFPMVWLIREGYTFAYVLLLGGPAAVISMYAIWLVWRKGWLPRLKDLSIHRDDRDSFFRMSGALLFAGVITTSTQFFMNWMVATRLGLAESGQFWTAWTLSMAYVTLVLGSLGTYYMPSLSSITDPEAQNALIRAYLRISLIAMPLLVSVVIALKPWVILGMFSSDLLPALKVMRWMLIGDLFKGISWVLGFPMLAFREMKWFFWTEVLFSLSISGAAWFWLSLGGSIEGLGMLFMLLYVAHLYLMSYYIRIMHDFVWKLEEVSRLLKGLALVLLMSVLTWGDEQVDWKTLALLGISFMVFILISLRGTAWRSHWSDWRGPTQ